MFSLDGNLGSGRFANSGSNAHVLSKRLRATSWNRAIDLTSERGVYNFCVQVVGGDGNGQAVEYANFVPERIPSDNFGVARHCFLRVACSCEFGRS